MSAEPKIRDRLLGQVLADRYQILHRLGEGAMGVVYKARHVKVGRPFAIKVLHPRALADLKVARRFEREAELAARLHHPNVVGVVDVGELEGTRYMVMDFAEGPDLAKLLGEAPMPPERIIHLVRQMLEGLYHAHEQGLIHRDFKPENVIVERDVHGAELPRIVDFGIALLREGGDSTDRVGRLTTNGLVLGTPHYMAPEQAVADPIDHRIDLFALGIVIYEMLSGRLPFDGNGAEVARANLLLDPPPIGKRVEHLEVDPLLEAFARRLMAKSRDRRPATAKVARELLDLIERDRPAAAKDLGIPVARSGRAQATTEPTIAADGIDPVGLPGVTTPMTPTPKPSQPIAWGEPPSAMPSSRAVPPYPGQFLRQPERVPHGGPHTPGPPARDPALRTALGWPVVFRPSRRWFWLVGGAVVGVASIAAVVVLSLPETNRDESFASAGPASAASAGDPGTSGSVAAPSTDRLPFSPPPRAPEARAPEARAPEARAPEAQPTEVTAAGPAPAVTDLAPRAPRGSAAVPTGFERKLGSPARRSSLPGVRARDQEAAASSGDTPVMHPDLEIAAPAARPQPREPEARGPDTRPKAGSPRAATPPAAPVGIAPGELGVLFDAVGREIRQLPGEEQVDLLDQLSRFKILEEMGAPGARRDQVADQLTHIRDEARRRRVGRKQP